MLKNISSLNLFAFLLVCFISFGCALLSEHKSEREKFGRVVKFYYGSGNLTLPPQYQYGTSIRGEINSDNIAIHLKNIEKGVKSERDFELTGEDFQQCLKMIQNTNILNREPTTGGGNSSPEVDLIDDNGKSRSGEPSNKDEWEQFERKLYDLAARVQ